MFRMSEVSNPPTKGAPGWKLTTPSEAVATLGRW
jgi:hypothetical protein